MIRWIRQKNKRVSAFFYVHKQIGDIYEVIGPNESIKMKSTACVPRNALKASSELCNRFGRRQLQLALILRWAIINLNTNIQFYIFAPSYRSRIAERTAGISSSRTRMLLAHDRLKSRVFDFVTEIASKRKRKKKCFIWWSANLFANSSPIMAGERKLLLMKSVARWTENGKSCF